VLEEMSSEFNANGLKVEEYSDTKFVGKVNSSSEGVIFTSIPYDENWRVYVDGKRVETFELVDSMLGFEIGNGEFDIEIKYVHKPFIIGSVISLIGIGIFILLCILEHKRKFADTVDENYFNELSSDENEIEFFEEEIDDYDIEDDDTVYEELSEENDDIPS
jgi:hypothetical protein